MEAEASAASGAHRSEGSGGQEGVRGHWGAGGQVCHTAWAKAERVSQQIMAEGRGGGEAQQKPAESQAGAPKRCHVRRWGSRRFRFPFQRTFGAPTLGQGGIKKNCRKKTVNDRKLQKIDIRSVHFCWRGLRYSPPRLPFFWAAA